MEKKSQDEMITAEILDLFDETFENVHGYYLDKGTSLFETLDKVSAEKASVISKGQESSIAGHIEHIRFYLETLLGYINGEIKGKTDWNKSWLVSEVSDDEWSILKSDLMKAYIKVKDTINGFTYWNDEDDFSGIISILVHSSFHLGAIWKMLEQIDNQ